MAAHSLVPHRMHAHLAFAGRHEDAPALGQETSRSLHDLLPAAIGRALEPALGSNDGVLRIDQVALHLRLGRAEASATAVADRLATAIAREIATHAAGCGAAPRFTAGLAYWPNPAAHAAAYIAARLGLAPAPAWAFPDFQALAHLPAPTAAVELIAARPETLAALARQLGPAAAAAFATRLPEPAAAALLARLLAASSPTPFSDAADKLAEMFATVPETVTSTPARAALATAITELSAHPAADAAIVRATVLPARLAAALAAIAATIETSEARLPTAADLSPAALARLPPAFRALAQDALAPLAASPGAQAALIATLAQACRPHRAPAPQTPATRPSPASRTVASRTAGIGLLLPAALEHATPLAPAALHLALAAALGPDAESAARLDPLLAVLVPFDPRDPAPTFPPVPAPLRATVPESQREGPAMGEGAAAWGACLAHACAARLTGFEASSLPYLRRQFLARPGTLHVTDRHLALVLDPLPLGIVLRLCGLHGWSATLLHTDATLRIEIADSAA